MSRLHQVVDLLRLTGKLDDPKWRNLVRRLQFQPDEWLEERALRELTHLAGDETFDPHPFPTISEDAMDIPGTEHIPIVTWGRAGKFDTGHEIVPGVPFVFPLLS